MSYRLGAAVGRLGAASLNTLKVGAPAARLSAQAPSKAYAEVPEALKQKMKIFQNPNGLPVHIKGGTTDKILLALTAIVCTLGVLESLRVYYVLSYPPKK
ncbi:cytochrome c oxidase subunit 7A1, mitochondrial [Procambarus clarkii]|uniref:cytochrome c oxidase subunit 7A1, mitochondrial n=1 Tax=Procambarus clarkii TaxID=6728 RepID=UPI001E670AC8|nr:cytochrome c oxidase subunit 7A1, mitochondrial-like [Procambarus clarkii]